MNHPPTSSPPTTDNDPLVATIARWQDVVHRVGQEVAHPLTVALDRVNDLINTGRIDGTALRQLRSELERARHAGMVSQQLARFASPDLRQGKERLHLPQMLKDVLSARQRDMQNQSHTVRPVVSPVEVLADPTLLFALLNASLDWALTYAKNGHVAVKVDKKLWPSIGRVRFDFERRDTLEPEQSLDDLTWHLVTQIAETIAVKITRQQEKHQEALTLEFTHVVPETLEGMSVVELDHGFNPSMVSRPIAGSHILVIAARRAVRVDVRDAIRDMGLVVDFVNSIDEAQAFCKQGLPHAIIVETVLRGERFDDLRADVLARRPDMAFVELVEEGNGFEISGFSGSSMAKVGRDAVTTSLASALSYELTREI